MTQGDGNDKQGDRAARRGDTIRLRLNRVYPGVSAVPTGLHPCGSRYPAMNGWAIIGRPYGTFSTAPRVGFYPLLPVLNKS